MWGFFKGTRLHQSFVPSGLTLQTMNPSSSFVTSAPSSTSTAAVTFFQQLHQIAGQHPRLLGDGQSHRLGIGGAVEATLAPEVIASVKKGRTSGETSLPRCLVNQNSKIDSGNICFCNWFLFWAFGSKTVERKIKRATWGSFQLPVHPGCFRWKGIEFRGLPGGLLHILIHLGQATIFV